MIFYLKSSISISSYDGCAIGCKYCILGEFENHDKVKKVSDEEELVKDLLHYKYYNKTIPISVNNQTEPFLNKEIFNSTIKILKELEKNKVKNPIIVITKGYLNDIEIKELSKIKKLNLLVLYTFSGLSETLENRDMNLQIETMKKLSTLSNIKLLHYYRPIINGINTDEKQIRAVLSITCRYTLASIISGIRVTKDINERLKDYNLKLPEGYSSKYKYISQEVYNKILLCAKEIDCNHRCFKKTSCAISFYSKKADYNGNSSRILYCKSECPSYEKCQKNDIVGFCSEKCDNFRRCSKYSKRKVKESQINKALRKIGREDTEYEIKEKFIYLKGIFEQEEMYYLRHNLGKNIKAMKVNKRYDESVLEDNDD